MALRSPSGGKSAAAAEARKPLSPRIAGLLRESWWLLAVAAAVYLLLILITYRAGDPSWSRQATGSQVHKAGGEVGAWFADILLYLFGLSAWWWLFGAVVAIVRGYRRIHRTQETDRRSVILAGIGFLVMLGASSAFEALRLYSLGAQLPQGP